MIHNSLRSIDWGPYPFDSDKLHRSYQLFSQLCRERQFPLRFASSYDFLPESGQLRGYWEAENDGWRRVHDPFIPSLVFDKAFGADAFSTGVIEFYDAEGLPMFDPTALAQLCNNKWRCYLQFAKYAPLTRLIQQDSASLVDQLFGFFEEMDRTYTEHDNKAIVKPLNGCQSRGIYVVARGAQGLELHYPFVAGQIHGDEIQGKLQGMLLEPYLIQAWVNTSEGLPHMGFEHSFADVRFVFIISEPGKAKFVQLYVKTLDGMVYVPVEAFEKDPFEIVNPIADWIADHYTHGLFCVDVMRDNSGSWFLTEINDQVGLTANWHRPEEVDGLIQLQTTVIEQLQLLAARTGVTY